VIRDNQGNVINYAKSCGEPRECSSFGELQCSEQASYQICDNCSVVPDSCYCPGKFALYVVFRNPTAVSKLETWKKQIDCMDQVVSPLDREMLIN